MRITSNIFQVGGPAESHPSDAAVYLIIAGGGILVDAGTGKGTPRVLANIQAAGIEENSVSHLFVTHCHFDHTGGVNGIREHTGCLVIAHELDAEFLEMGDPEVTAANWYGSFMEPTKIDIKVEEPRRVFSFGDTDITMYHTPGHSPGSAVLTMESDGEKVLFGQDVHGPLNEVLRSSRADYVQSLEFLLSLEADILCEGHFGVYHGKEKVQRFIESFL
jgi:glyoxylase-like metal-dependent hydrolase (beta-lactamase superfamily II)